MFFFLLQTQEDVNKEKQSLENEVAKLRYDVISFLCQGFSITQVGRGGEELSGGALHCANLCPHLCDAQTTFVLHKCAVGLGNILAVTRFRTQLGSIAESF